jgi:hypothetical protein
VDGYCSVAVAVVEVNSSFLCCCMCSVAAMGTFKWDITVQFFKLLLLYKLRDNSIVGKVAKWLLEE